MSSVTITEQDEEQITLDYRITYDPLPDKRIEKLPRKAKTLIDQMYIKAHSDPEYAIPRLIKANRKYPNIPVFLNFLATAYAHAGQLKKYEQTAADLIEEHPNYLFGRLSYAESCLRNGTHEKVPEIFDGKFDLKLLYPTRKVFHVTEVTVFMGIIGLYYQAEGKRAMAEKYHVILLDLSPNHIMTKKLEKALNPNRLAL